jgi:hypothetical protein
MRHTTPSVPRHHRTALNPVRNPPYVRTHLPKPRPQTTHIHHLSRIQVIATPPQHTRHNHPLRL